jgi:magnesium-protoporphyrin IX monomethyl ester (oxidative) cyclase
MLRVLLVNMPFADWYRPSFALSQLAALARREFPDDVDVDVLYLNQRFAELLGTSTYDAISGDTEHLVSGVGDWLFNRLAFPEAPDSAEDYFGRYYTGPRWEPFREWLRAIREQLPAVCDELLESHAMASADVVGFTSMFAQTAPSIAMARLVKAADPGTITIMGGANCETPMGAAITENVPVLDFVFSGPALHTFPDFLRCVLEGRPSAAISTPGILSRDNVQRLSSRHAIGRDRDIDDFIEPDYESFRAALCGSSGLGGDASAPTAPLLPFETSRGCWWGERSHCTFCGLNGLSMGYRSMSPDTALRQFRWLFGFHPWSSSFHCTDNILPKRYLKEVLPHLEAPEGVSVFYEVKLPISEADMKVMAAAGVNKVQPGIEALATATLKLMGKGTTVFQNLQFLKSCVSYGVQPQWNLLVGFPGEEEAVYQKYARDIPSLVHLPPPTGVHMVRFDRYSPYFTRRADYGLNLHPMDFYRLVYPFDDDALEQLAYYFSDHSLGSYMLTAARWLRPLSQLTEEWRRRWTANGAQSPPRLSLERLPDGAGLVRDTRSGVEREVSLDAAARRLVERLASPVRADRLAAECRLDRDDVATGLHLLEDHELLFEEDGRLLSLVSLDEPVVAATVLESADRGRLGEPR